MPPLSNNNLTITNNFKFSNQNVRKKSYIPTQRTSTPIKKYKYTINSICTKSPQEKISVLNQYENNDVKFPSNKVKKKSYILTQCTDIPIKKHEYTINSICTKSLLQEKISILNQHENLATNIADIRKIFYSNSYQDFKEWLGKEPNSHICKVSAFSQSSCVNPILIKKLLEIIILKNVQEYKHDNHIDWLSPKHYKFSTEYGKDVVETNFEKIIELCIKGCIDIDFLNLEKIFKQDEDLALVTIKYFCITFNCRSNIYKYNHKNIVDIIYILMYNSIVESDTYKCYCRYITYLLENKNSNALDELFSKICIPVSHYIISAVLETNDFSMVRALIPHIQPYIILNQCNKNYYLKEGVILPIANYAMQHGAGSLNDTVLTAISLGIDINETETLYTPDYIGNLKEFIYKYRFSLHELGRLFEPNECLKNNIIKCLPLLFWAIYHKDFNMIDILLALGAKRYTTDYIYNALEQYKETSYVKNLDIEIIREDEEYIKEKLTTPSTLAKISAVNLAKYLVSNRKLSLSDIKNILVQNLSVYAKKVKSIEDLFSLDKII